MAIVRTVLGDIEPEELGFTLTHEHLSMDFSHFYRKPPSVIAHKFEGSLQSNMFGYVRQYPYSHKGNLVLNDPAAKTAVYTDLHEYKRVGGGAIVENSAMGLDRNTTAVKKMSIETDVHVVVGTGHYITDTQPDNYVHNTEEEIYNHMKKELTSHCIDDAEAKAGFMGEIASVWPLRSFERKVIRAAGELQKEIGCGVSFHPHRHPEAPFEIIRLYLEAGGSSQKAVMSHLDRTLSNVTVLEFSELGTYCQFDLFGVEVSYYQLNVETDMPSDAQRIQMIKAMVDEGLTDKVLMSHDIHTKHRLTTYGGHGYSHIMVNVLPKMKSKGFTTSDLNQITRVNPKRWLAFDPTF